MAFKMKKSSYKMGGVKTKDTMAYMKSPLEAAKPDYIDIDKDGNTTESMKEAASALKTTGVQEFPKDLGLSPGERGKAIKRHDEAYKRGHTEHTGQPQDEKSPIEQEEDDKLDDKYLSSNLSTEVAKSGDRFKQRPGSLGSSTGEVRWIRDNFGRNLSRKQLMEAQREYFALVSRESEGNPVSSEVNETPVVEEDQAQREDKGVDNQTEFSKAVNKGYFNKGEGSEYISTMPKPEDFATFEEFEAAKRKHEMDYPDVNTMAKQ